MPGAPVIDLAESLVADNCVTLVWRMPDEDSKIDHYVLEYRRTNFEGPPRLKEEQPWMVIEGIRQTEFTLTGKDSSTLPLTHTPSPGQLSSSRIPFPLSAGGLAELTGVAESNNNEIDIDDRCCTARGGRSLLRAEHFAHRQCTCSSHHQHFTDEGTGRGEKAFSVPVLPVGSSARSFQRIERLQYTRPCPGTSEQSG